jgi:hypothetical protein
MEITMKKFTTAALALALLAGLQVPAAFAATGNNTGKITTLLWYEGHQGLLVRQEGMSDLGGCGRGDYFIVDNSHPNLKEIYAMLLLAYTSDIPVGITVTDCTQGLSRVRHVSIVR